MLSRLKNLENYRTFRFEWLKNKKMYVDDFSCNWICFIETFSDDGDEKV